MANHSEFHPPLTDNLIPHAAPASREQPTRGLRFEAWLIDCAILIVLAFPLSALIAFLRYLIVIPLVPAEWVLWPLLGTSTLLAYYALFEGVGQKTPGKWLRGMEVIDSSGAHPAWWRIAVRTLCRFLPFEPLSGLFGRPWHDQLSGTFVVKLPRP